MTRTRQRLDGERGTTLVELMVTIMILAIVMGAVTGAVVATHRTVRNADQRYADLGEARIAMDATSKLVRTAVRLNPDDPAFIDAGPDHVAFYANVDVTNDDPKLVRLEVQGDDLIQTVEEGDVVSTNSNGETERGWTGDGSPRSRTIARNLTNPVQGEPVFEYFGHGEVDPFVLTGGELAESDQDDVRHVRVELRVDSDAAPDVEETVLVNRVRIPNFYYIDAQEVH